MANSIQIGSNNSKTCFYSKTGKLLDPCHQICGLVRPGVIERMKRRHINDECLPTVGEHVRSEDRSATGHVTGRKGNASVGQVFPRQFSHGATLDRRLLPAADVPSRSLTYLERL